MSMNQYGYGGRPNPFDQRGGGDDGYGAPAARPPPQAAFGQGPRPGGGAPRYNQPANGYGQTNVEMAPLTQNAGSFAQGDPNAILNECRDIDRGIDEIENNLNQLRMLQDRSLNEADTSTGSATSRQLDNLSSQTMTLYRGLTQRVREVKSSPESRQPKNAPQVGRVDRRLKQAIQNYQQVESAFRKKTQDQMARQYRIVRPDASEAEVRDAVEDSAQGGQVFQQAMMQSDRRGQARAVLSAVQDRQAALEKIERQMIELAQLFQDMDTLVVQQDVQVTQIEQKGEETVENLDKGNQEMEVAVTTARKTRKKKWICLGISVGIIAIVVIIVVIYMLVIKPQGGGGGGGNNGQNNQKRGLEIRGVDFDGERPVAGLYKHSKIVVPGVNFDETDTSTKRQAPPADTPLQRRRLDLLAGDAAPVKRIVIDPKFRGDSSASKEKKYVVVGQAFDEDTLSAAKRDTTPVPNIAAELSHRIVIDPKFKSSNQGRSQSEPRRLVTALDNARGGVGRLSGLEAPPAEAGQS